MPGERTKTWQGSKWCRPSKRLAVYHRDRFRCAWCDRHVSEVALSLDHIARVADGGTNEPSNLVTSCFLCNQDREHITPSDWPVFLLVFWARPATVVRDAVTRAREEPLDRAWARAQLEDKPPWLLALRARSSRAWQASNLVPPADYPGHDAPDLNKMTGSEAAGQGPSDEGWAG